MTPFPHGPDPIAQSLVFPICWRLLFSVRCYFLLTIHLWHLEAVLHTYYLFPIVVLTIYTVFGELHCVDAFYILFRYLTDYCWWYGILFVRWVHWNFILQCCSGVPLIPYICWLFLLFQYIPSLHLFVLVVPCCSFDLFRCSSIYSLHFIPHDPSARPRPPLFLTPSQVGTFGLLLQVLGELCIPFLPRVLHFLFSDITLPHSYIVRYLPIYHICHCCVLRFVVDYDLLFIWAFIHLPTVILPHLNLPIYSFAFTFTTTTISLRYRRGICSITVHSHCSCTFIPHSLLFYTFVVVVVVIPWHIVVPLFTLWCMPGIPVDYCSFTPLLRLLICCYSVVDHLTFIPDLFLCTVVGIVLFIHSYIPTFVRYHGICSIVPFSIWSGVLHYSALLENFTGGGVGVRCCFVVPFIGTLLRYVLFYSRWYILTLMGWPRHMPVDDLEAICPITVLWRLPLYFIVGDRCDLWCWLCHITLWALKFADLWYYPLLLTTDTFVDTLTPLLVPFIDDRYAGTVI